MINNKINYSIIIPHKNATDLLQRCLNSIPRREDIQIIIIDDSSDSDKVIFDNFPGSNDNQIEIIFSKEKKGAGYARNIGLSRAAGKWLLFADADDYFTYDFIQVIDKYKDTDYDLIYFGILGIDSKTRKENHIGKYYNKLMLNAVKNNKYDKYKYSNWNPWGKMILSSLVKENSILFDETKAANDKMFSLKTACFSKNTFITKEKIYVYETREGSLITNNSLELHFDRLCVDVRSNDFLRNNGKNKFRTNIVRRLYLLVNKKDMDYFYRGLKYLKGNYHYLFLDIIISIFYFPIKVIRKIMKILFGQ